MNQHTTILEAQPNSTARPVSHMGLVHWLTVVFAYAKVTGKSNMSWNKVFMPMYVALALTLGVKGLEEAVRRLEETQKGVYGE